MLCLYLAGKCMRNPGGLLNSRGTDRYVLTQIQGSDLDGDSIWVFTTQFSQLFCRLEHFHSNIQKKHILCTCLHTHVSVAKCPKWSPFSGDVTGGSTPCPYLLWGVWGSWGASGMRISGGSLGRLRCCRKLYFCGITPLVS